MRRVIVGIAVVAVILGILARRAVTTHHRPESPSAPATAETNIGTRNPSGAQSDFPAGLALATSAGPLQDQRPPEFANRSTIQERALAEGLEASIKSNFPGYRAPQAKDMTSNWAVEKQASASPFMCRGDFAGDGADDTAIILIGEEGWRLVVFQKDGRGKYRPAFVARPKNKEELGKYWEKEILAAPQQLVLRTVKKGNTWAPEADDDPNLGPMTVDAIELIAKPVPNYYFSSLLVFKEGKYQQIYRDPLVEVPASAL